VLNTSIEDCKGQRQEVFNRRVRALSAKPKQDTKTGDLYTS